MGAGMDDYVAKPVDPTKLRRVLEKWLPGYCHPSAEEEVRAMQTPEVEPYHASEALSPAEPVFDHAAMSERLMGDKELIHTVKSF